MKKSIVPRLADGNMHQTAPPTNASDHLRSPMVYHPAHRPGQYRATCRAEQNLEAGALVFVCLDDVHAYTRYDNAECELINIGHPSTVVEQLFSYLGNDFNPDVLLRPALSPVIYLSTEARAHFLGELNRLASLPSSQVDVLLCGFLAYVCT